MTVDTLGVAARTGVSVEAVNEVSARTNLDRLARRFLNMSGEEFMRRREAGDLETVQHDPAFTRVDAVASLLD